MTESRNLVTMSMRPAEPPMSTETTVASVVERRRLLRLASVDGGCNVGPISVTRVPPARGPRSGPAADARTPPTAVNTEAATILSCRLNARRTGAEVPCRQPPDPHQIQPRVTWLGTCDPREVSFIVAAFLPLVFAYPQTDG